MALVLIEINGVQGQIDEILLRRTDGNVNNNVENTNWSEHCLINCGGQAHTTGEPDEEFLFCRHHVKREVHIRLK